MFSCAGERSARDVCEAHALFEDFLMHGYIDHHETPPRTTVDELAASQQRAHKRLVITYLREGFGDPGLGLFSSEEHDELRAAARLRAP
jgi:hypothetical protein